MPIFTLNNTQQEFLEQFIQDYIKPRVKELISTALIHDSKLPRIDSAIQHPAQRAFFEHPNLIGIINLLGHIQKDSDESLFQKVIKDTYPSKFNLEQLRIEKIKTIPNSIKVLLALHYLATNTSTPLAHTLVSDVICDPRLSTCPPGYNQTEKTTQAILEQVSFAVKKELSSKSLTGYIADCRKQIASQNTDTTPATKVTP